MEAFMVSALKYRPTSFEDVVGQQNITQTLKNSLEKNQLAQALLFCGPRGVGKTSCARILAKQINKSNLDQTTQDDFAFNIFELDAASNNSVEDIRKINEQVRIPPQVGSHKIYIIDEAHMLSKAAFNAFLKTLEEPPKHVIFILATTEKNKIIPTILSRCQVYDFKRISVKDIQTYLVKIAQDRNLKFEESALFLIAQKAEGALRDALSIFDRMVSFTKGNLSAIGVADNLNLLDHQTYEELGEIIFKNDIHGILKEYDELLKRGIDPLQFIKGLGDFFRNLMLAKDTGTLSLMELSENIKMSYQNLTKTISPEYLIDAIALINSFEINYKNVTNKRVHIELGLMKLASLHFNGEKKKDFIIPAQIANELIKSNKKVQNNLTSKKNPQSKTIVKESADNITKSYHENKKTISNQKEPSQRLQIKIKDPITNENNKREVSVSGFSLSSIAVKKAAKKLYRHEIKEKNLPEDTFTPEVISQFWNEYAENIKVEGKKNIASIMGMNIPEMKNQSTISFFVANDMNKVEMTNEMKLLLPFLKEKLNHYGIKIEIIVKKTIKEDSVYSPKEKYQYLVKINPTLEKLRKNFDLDF